MSPAHTAITDSTSSQRQACSTDPSSLQEHNHNMMNSVFDPEIGGEVPQMIEGAATIGADFKYDPAKKDWFTVTAKVASKGVGHRFPTDSPLRHLILVVEARDERNTLLTQVDGDRIPNWGGVGNVTFEDPNMRFYAGLPGKIFTNLLADVDTNISPTAAYWNETKYAWIGKSKDNPYDYSDTRLIPGIVDKSPYSFQVPNAGEIIVTIKLVYRFAFFDLMQEKGWHRPDITVASKKWDCKRSQDKTSFDCK